MKRYCCDTSGLSNPLEMMPEDIHQSLWHRISRFIKAGSLAVTSEIYDEMVHLPGSIGDCIRANKAAMVLEVGEPGWNWNAYVSHGVRMQDDYKEYISEYNGGSKKTVGLNDISIIALGKTLSLPVISMESLVPLTSNKRRIPNICDADGVQHKTFSDFLRAESFKF